VIDAANKCDLLVELLTLRDGDIWTLSLSSQDRPMLDKNDIKTLIYFICTD
jgi:hypothetical protein